MCVCVCVLRGGGAEEGGGKGCEAEATPIEGINRNVTSYTSFPKLTATFFSWVHQFSPVFA